jgi:hypothetical protein
MEADEVWGAQVGAFGWNGAFWGLGSWLLDLKA